MLTALLLVPFLGAAVAAVIPSNRVRPLVLPVTGVLHLALVLVAVGITLGRGEAALDDPLTQQLWVHLDELGSFVLLTVSVVFALVGFYAPGYLALRAERPNRFLVVAAQAFLGFATLACGSQHGGMLWVAVESATLTMAPLIYFNRNSRSLEATWKYLVIGAVGMALALLGTFFVVYGRLVVAPGVEAELTFSALTRNALSPPWLRVGFVLLLVGYCTKMGLAPLHTWKPDAYGEAPGMVGALLSGGMTSLAFLALTRWVGVVAASGDVAFAHDVMVALGLFSMAWAAVFMVRQTDLKRLLAYSSVEHMGILVLALGLGPLAFFPCLLHLAGNALTKCVMFLAAGNIHRAFGSKHIPVVCGAIRRLPVSGALLLGGFIAVTGSPPFSPFLSEFGILSVAFDSGRTRTGVLFLVFLGIIFVGLSSTVIAAVQGEPEGRDLPVHYRDRCNTVAAPVVALVAVLLLGLWVPQPMRELMQRAQQDVFPAAAVRVSAHVPGGQP